MRFLAVLLLLSVSGCASYISSPYPTEESICFHDSYAIKTFSDWRTCLLKAKFKDGF